MNKVRLRGTTVVSILIACLLTVLVFIIFTPHTTQAAPTRTNIAASNCRYGVGVSPDNSEIQEPWLDTVGAGWFTDFLPFNESTDTAEYVRIVRVSQNRDAAGNRLDSFSVYPDLLTLRQMVYSYPGALWVVGNEPDVSKQDDMMPQLYAQAYHAVHKTIKEADPSAQVGAAALVQVTPGRLQYLDIMYDTYASLYNHSMPVDVWTMHLYVLPELFPNGDLGVAEIALGTNPALGRLDSENRPEVCGDPYDNVYCYAEHDDIAVYAQQVRSMRQWMADHGHRNKPLMITEYSILYPYEPEYDNFGNLISCHKEDEFGQCFDPVRVSEFMRDTFDYLKVAKDSTIGLAADQNRLVQQWNWFSLGSDGVGRTSSLLKDNYPSFVGGSTNALTLMGQTFRSEVSDDNLIADLRIENVEHTYAFTQPSTGFASVRVSVSFRNSGNVAVDQPVRVHFFKDAAHTLLIDEVFVNTTIAGCARQVYDAYAYWGLLTPGVHPYWVKIDPYNEIPELFNSDNQGEGVVIVDGAVIFMPVTLQ